MTDVLKATHLLYADDFTSYTSDADVVAAYPNAVAPGDTYDEQATDWGATYGPDGQPGIKDQVSAPARDTGAITKNGLNPNGREFRIKGRWNFAATNHILGTHLVLDTAWESPGDIRSGSWQINRTHSSGTLSLVVKTTTAYGNVVGNTRYLVDLPGAVPTGTPQLMEIRWRQSEMTETSPGVFDPSTDGRVELYLEGVRVAEFDGPVWNRDNDFNASPYWNSCEVQTVGAFAAWEIWDEPNPLSGSDDSIPSCCRKKKAKKRPGGGDLGTNPDPVGVLPPWQSACSGGGLVDGAVDLMDGESWL